jgi:hypothetical protein
MKALTVRPPWAWAILHAGKAVENRGKRTNHRGPLVIHAGRVVVALERFPTGVAVPPEAIRVTGALVGLVELIDCRPVADLGDNPWASGPWCWVLANPRPLSEPIPFAGMVGLFDVPDDLIR